IGGRISMNSPSSLATTGPQPSRMWRLSESALYWVRMYTWRRSELMQLERVMSMMRYWPANGTAGLARSRVRGKSRSPAPPASKTPSVSLISQNSGTALGRTANHVSQMRKPDCTYRETRVYHARWSLVILDGKAQRNETPQSAAWASWEAVTWLGFGGVWSARF